MNKIDALLQKAKEIREPGLLKRLKTDNEYLSKSLDELLNCMTLDNYTVPSNGSEENAKFLWALMIAYENENGGAGNVS